MDDVVLSVADFVALTNQTLEYAFPSVVIEGEVSSFNVNQNKFVFFDLKDDEAAVSCFMMLFQLRLPIEDGMKIRVHARPKLTNKGRFSLTVRSITPVGEGELRRSLEMLTKKLNKEGLFDESRKRLLPRYPTRIAVISSRDAAGYADFVKIIDSRWRGMEIDLANTQVQGEKAPDQIIQALQYLNESSSGYDVIALMRGGGSLEDLMAFNDEALVRAVAASRTPVIVGVGHETDTTLAELAADVAAATPSNAAQILVPDVGEEIQRLNQMRRRLLAISISRHRFEAAKGRLDHRISEILARLQSQQQVLKASRLTLRQIHPALTLQRGYAIVRKNAAVVRSSTEVEKGESLMIQLHQGQLQVTTEDKLKDE